VHEPLDELLLLPLREERRPLEWPELRGDPDRAEVVDDGLRDRSVGAVDRVIAGEEAVGIARLG